jgi:hypothetical protein
MKHTFQDLNLDLPVQSRCTNHLTETFDRHISQTLVWIRYYHTRFGLPRGIFLSGFRKQFSRHFYEFLISHSRATWPTHPHISTSLWCMVKRTEYEAPHYTSNLLPLLLPPFLGANIPHNTLIPRSSLHIRLCSKVLVLVLDMFSTGSRSSIMQCHFRCKPSLKYQFRKWQYKETSSFWKQAHSPNLPHSDIKTTPKM